MKKVFLIHGFEGKPNGGWRPWFMRELEKLDIYACALPMPTPDFPKRDEWVSEIARHIPEDRSQIFLVGHSLGVPAILRYLQTHPAITKFAGIFLVSGPVERNPNPASESFKKLGSFFEAPFDFNIIREQAQRFVVLHGDNDAMVPFAQAEILSTKLSCELVTIANGGHLNGSSGFYTLPQLLEKFQSLV